MANLGKNWKMLEPFKAGEELTLEYPKWFLEVLANRGIKTKEEILEFLEPKYENLYPTSAFNNMVGAVERIALAKEKNEKVVVYGDYDVDGITTTVLVKEALNKIGIQNVETYIPHREEEGYGLNENAVKEIIKGKASLIVSVDCGVTSGELIDKYASEIDFIVVDHHEITEEKLPGKAIVLHPEMTAEGYKPQKLSACGMAFFLGKALMEKFSESVPEGQEKWLLDLVALSTICDVVPLVEQNRILVKFGLVVISKTKRIGLEALCAAASIKREEVNAYAIGFLLGPRLNASGRLQSAKVALDLLTATEEKEARELARKLNELNAERQKMCERILEEAKAEIEKSGTKDDEIYLLSNKNWPRGVVGIIAGRLSDSYIRPVIVFEDDGEAHHGSARSVGTFDITEVLGECSDCLLKFGGHAKAAGLTVAADKFVIFKDKILEITKNKIKTEDLRPEIKIDAEVELADVNDNMLELLSRLEPYGFGNSSPAFVIKKAQATGIRKVGDQGQHLKFTVGTLGAIWFSAGKEVKEKEFCDIVFNPRYNEWNNRRSIELRVLDLKESK
jgi:single-stranded-DNA-specific exonuclease